MWGWRAGARATGNSFGARAPALSGGCGGQGLSRAAEERVLFLHSLPMCAGTCPVPPPAPSAAPPASAQEKGEVKLQCDITLEKLMQITGHYFVCIVSRLVKGSLRRDLKDKMWQAEQN